MSAGDVKVDGGRTTTSRTSASSRLDARTPDPELVRLAVGGDQSAWREIMVRYDGPVREAIVGASLGPDLSQADLDDLMGDFWLSLVENDMQRLRRFDPTRGAALLSWLTIQIVQMLRGHEARRAEQPDLVPLDEARPLPVDIGPTILDNKQIDPSSIQSAREYFTIRQLCARFGISKSQGYQLARQVGFTRIGSRGIRVSARRLERFIEERTCRSFSSDPTRRATSAGSSCPTASGSSATRTAATRKRPKLRLVDSNKTLSEVLVKPVHPRTRPRSDEH